LSYRQQFLDLLPYVSKPGRYLGNEINAVRKDFEAVEVSWAFVFPDLYEIGMSHLGLRILYHLINQFPQLVAERVFAPDLDLESLLREKKIPLLSLESGRPLKNFDLIGFSLQYELSYTNILNILDLAQIPLLSSQRGEEGPLILAGGPGAFNPEPLADFIDGFVIGEGEEVVLEISETVRNWKKEKKTSKKELLFKLSQIEGVYIPTFYEALYDSEGRFQGLRPKEKNVPPKIKRRVVQNLEKVFYPTCLIVPFVEIVHDRISLEISRGCNRGCRFCQASVIYRPKRERSIAKLTQLLEETIKKTGYGEVSLLSLNPGDYSKIQSLLTNLGQKLAWEKVSLSFPSLNVETYLQNFAEEVKRVRKSGFTFAPEVASLELSQKINKPFQEEILLKVLKNIFQAGWRSVKLYFLIGLPGEKEEDLDKIIKLVKKICALPQSRGIVVNISSFIPKSHTPFQWEGQEELEKLKGKIERIRKGLTHPRVRVKYHLPEASFLEAIFSRGDRRIGRVLLSAWQKGCKFDEWSERFRFDLWQEAFEETKIDPHFYAQRKISYNEPLPWDHIFTGIKKEFLIQENQKAQTGEITPHCLEQGCQGCGGCKEVMRTRLETPCTFTS
jgi:radical SAM family uncharacterized protein